MDKNDIFCENAETMNAKKKPGYAYAPFQRLGKLYDPETAMRAGTIFPELVSPYMPGQSMAENDYLRRTNEIGEGCNG